MQTCPQCGTENEDLATFCDSCGNDLTGAEEQRASEEPVAELAPEEETEWKCAKCDHHNAPQTKFCSQCGGQKGATPEPEGAGKTMFFGAVQDQGSAKLTLIKGGGFEGVSYQLSSTEHLAGSQEGFMIFPEDPYCSPVHCNFFYDGGKLFVEDKDSVNGVYVRIKDPVALRTKTFFRVGEQLFHFDVLENYPPIANLKMPEDGTVLFGSPVEQGKKIQLAQVLDGGQIGAVYYIQKDNYLIGREGCDLNFPTDRFISGKHAKLSEQDGAWTLTDSGSKNGTYVRVGEKRELNHGDFVFIGQQLLRVEIFES